MELGAKEFELIQIALPFGAESETQRIIPVKRMKIDHLKRLSDLAFGNPNFFDLEVAHGGEVRT